MSMASDPPAAPDARPGSSGRGQSRGRGRPKFAGTYRKSTIYLREELLSALDTVAETAGLSRSAYLERLCRADPLIAAVLSAEEQRTAGE